MPRSRLSHPRCIGGASSGSAGGVRVRLLVAAAVVAACAGLSLLLPLVVGGRGEGLLQALIPRLVGAATGYSLQARRISIAPGPALVFDDLALLAPVVESDAPPARPAMLRARRLALLFTPRALLHARLGRLELVDFTYCPPPSDRSDHAWETPATGGAAVARFPLAVEELQLIAGRVALPPAGGDEESAYAGSPCSTRRGLVEVDRASVLRVGERLLIDADVDIGPGAAVLRASGSAELAGRDLDVRVAMTSPDLAAAMRAIGLGANLPPGARAQGNLSLTGDLEDVLQVEIDAYAEPSTESAAAAIRLDAHAALRRGPGTVELSADVRPGDDLPTLRLTGGLEHVGLPWAGTTADFEVRWSQVAAEQLAPFALSWAPLLGDASRWPQVRGTVQMEARVTSGTGATEMTVLAGADALTMRAADGSELSAASVDLRAQTSGSGDGSRLSIRKLAVSGLAAHDADSVHLLDKLSFTLKGSAGRSTANDADLEFEADAASGELLWDRVYLDLERLPVHLAAQALWSEDRVEVRNANLASPAVGSIGGGGSYGRRSGLESFDVHFDVPGLATAYEVFVREPLGDAHPVLARARVDGQLSGAIRHRAAAGKLGSYVGRIRLQAGSIDLTEPAMTLRGLTLDLPVNVADLEPSGGSESGAVGFARLEIGGVSVEPIHAPIRVRPNRVEVADTVSFALFGGSVELGGLRADRLAGEDRELTGWIDLDQVDLAAASVALGWPQLEGSLGGRLSKVEISTHEVRTEGELTGALFGGVLELSNLGASRLFSRIPTLQLTAALKRADLKRVTASLGVGRISGIVDARIDDLQITAGQPVRFDASLETVPIRGAKQRVSVKAIEQLSILGGAGSNPISRGILSAFEDYRYAKLGFRCRLRNDRFTLRGVESFDGKDFLVVGTLLPPTVNVVSHNQVVAFKEMVRRLSRITTGG